MVTTNRFTLFGVIFLLSGTIFCAPVDPLSKITIKSSRATCTKNKNDQRDVIFKYLDQVHVDFADGSTVSSQELEIVCNFSKSPSDDLSKKIVVKNSSQENSKKSDKASSNFKKITFSKKVVINKDAFKATADYADILVEQRLCTLRGNVHIEHKKNFPKDVPIQVTSDAATIRLDSQQILFAGSPKSPVSTVIDLQDHPIIRNKTDKKKSKKQMQGAVKKS